MDGLHLAVYAPLGDTLARRDIGIDADVTGLTWSAKLPGGLDKLQIGLRRLGDRVYTGLPEPIEARHFNHCELWLGSDLLADGRVGPTETPTDSLTVLGYADALGDQVFRATDTTLISSGALIVSALANAAPAVVASGDWDDPQTLHAPAEFDGRTPGQVLEALAQEGYADGSLLDWLLLPGARLALRSRPGDDASPDYVIGFDERRMRWTSDPSNLAGTVTLRYTGTASGSAAIGSGATSVVLVHNLGVAPAPGEITLTPTALPPNNVGQVAVTATSTTSVTIACQFDPGGDFDFDWAIAVKGAEVSASNAGFRARWGLDRALLLDNGGELTRAQATQLASTLLACGQDPLVSAELTLGWEELLPGPDGLLSPAYRAALSEVVQLGHAPDAPRLPIVGGTWDANARTVRLELGRQRPSYQNLLDNLRRSLARQAAGRNPVTGGAV